MFTLNFVQKKKIDRVGHTNTQFDDKMRLESVKGCQWELIYGWTSVLATFLHPPWLS